MAVPLKVSATKQRHSKKLATNEAKMQAKCIAAITNIAVVQTWTMDTQHAITRYATIHASFWRKSAAIVLVCAAIFLL